MWQKRSLVIGVFLGTLLALPTTSAFAQQTDPVIEALHTDVVSVFFENVKSQAYKQAYTTLFGTKQLGTEEDRDTLVTETAKIEGKYGAYRSFERVYAKRVGSDLIFMKYLYKCENFPVLWHITFYRTSTSGDVGPESRPWQVVSIRFDTDLEILTLLTNGK